MDEGYRVRNRGMGKGGWGWSWCLCLSSGFYWEEHEVYGMESMAGNQCLAFSDAVGLDLYF